jgi:N-methylhydantoinase A
VPRGAGVFSAYGLCVAEIAQHFVRTFRARLDTINYDELEDAWRGVEEQARAAMEAEGVASEAIAVRRLADLRYVGQSTELLIPYDTEGARSATQALEAAFAAEHARAYGHELEDAPVELVALRVTAVVPAAEEHPPSGHVDNGGQSVAAAEPVSREAFFGPAHGWLSAPVYQARADYRGGCRGPCIVELYDTTVVVPPHWRVALDVTGSLVLTAEGTCGK